MVALPALVHVTLEGLFERGLKQTAIDLALGLSPLIAWELFSLFYYGFLFPNTAFAKLNTGLPRNELMQESPCSDWNFRLGQPACRLPGEAFATGCNELERRCDASRYAPTPCRTSPPSRARRAR